MKKLYFSLAILATLFGGFFISPASAQAPVLRDKINVIEFYREDCPHCQAVKPFLDGIAEKYKDSINFKRYEVVQSQEARDLFTVFLDDYAIPRGEGGVPTLFIGDKYFMGDVPIEQGLEPALVYDIANGAKLNNNLDAAVGIQAVGAPAPATPAVQSAPQSRLQIIWSMIVATALMDSINPCAIAVLLFLVAFLVAIRAKKSRLLALGGIYIFGVFTTYLLAGFGLLKIIHVFDLSNTFKYIAAAVLALAGLINIKDFFWYGKGISLKIPDRVKPTIEKYLQTGSIPMVFLAGVLVSAFQLPCTGEVYLGVLSMISSTAATTKELGIFYLVLYNLIFVTPLVIVLLAATFGVNINKIEEMRQDRKKWLRLVIGIGMIALAYWILKR